MSRLEDGAADQGGGGNGPDNWILETWFWESWTTADGGKRVWGIQAASGRYHHPLTPASICQDPEQD
ncbi:hypothetical protein E4U53_004776 [Claviceps sorghi]|nr:hypothetical protein E4U53_004776 [Claviceps sorghi]